MNLRLELLLIIITASTSLALFLAIRKGNIRGGFVALWLAICLMLVTMPFLESFYKLLASAMGLNLAVNMLYMFAILFLMVYVFYLTVKLQRLSDSVDTLLARSAIVENHLGLIYQNSRLPSDFDKSNPVDAG